MQTPLPNVRALLHSTFSMCTAALSQMHTCMHRLAQSWHGWLQHTTCSMCTAALSRCTHICTDLHKAGMAGCSEVIDAMYQPSRYDQVYPFSYLYTYAVSVPHSILIQLANPTANAAFGTLSPCSLAACCTYLLHCSGSAIVCLQDVV